MYILGIVRAPEPCPLSLPLLSARLARAWVRRSRRIVGSSDTPLQPSLFTPVTPLRTTRCAVSVTVPVPACGRSWASRCSYRYRVTVLLFDTLSIGSNLISLSSTRNCAVRCLPEYPRTELPPLLLIVPRHVCSITSCPCPLPAAVGAPRRPCSARPWAAAALRARVWRFLREPPRRARAGAHRYR